jgi:4-diphosphocytidyl-2C-methyl-D-erythritol kinase
MSGSGPVIFGLFSEPEEMKGAEKRLSLPPDWKTIQAKGI